MLSRPTVSDTITLRLGWQGQTLEALMAFAERLRELRRQQFLSQAELARRSGIHKLTILRLENGASLPQGRTVRRLAEALGVQPSELAAPTEIAGGL
jgi:HTH-type transcriptional regulator, competence development regulator